MQSNASVAVAVAAADVKSSGVPVVSSDQKPLNNFECPISHEVMTDPVCFKGHAEGLHVFERKEIVEWLTRKATCPCCNVQITDKTLVSPNSVFMQALASFKQSQAAIAKAKESDAEANKLKAENQSLRASLAQSSDAKESISVADKKLHQHTRMMGFYNTTIDEKQKSLVALKLLHGFRIRKFLRKNLGTTFDKKDHKQDEKGGMSSAQGFQQKYRDLRHKIIEQVKDRNNKTGSAYARLQSHIGMAKTMGTAFQDNNSSLASCAEVINELKQINTEYQKQKEERKKEVDDLHVEKKAMQDVFDSLIKETNDFKAKKAKLLSELKDTRAALGKEVYAASQHFFSRSYPRFSDECFMVEQKSAQPVAPSLFAHLTKEERIFCELVYAGDVVAIKTFLTQCQMGVIPPINLNCVMTASNTANLSPLLEAIRKGDYETVSSLLAFPGINLNQEENFKGTLRIMKGSCGNFDDMLSPLIVAAMSLKNSSQIIEKIMEYQEIDVNKAFQNGWTALHYAALAWNVDAIKCLIKKGACPDVRNIYDKLPIQIAEEIWKSHDGAHAVRQAIQEGIAEYKAGVDKNAFASKPTGKK